MKNITISQLSELYAIPVQERHRRYIPEFISTSYPIAENGQEFVDLQAYAQKQNVPIVIAPVSQETRNTFFLRQGAAFRLVNAASDILAANKRKLTLKITDAFRPVYLQQRYFDEISADIAGREGLNGKQLWERVTQFIADPRLCPPHTTGGAVDLTIVDIESVIDDRFIGD